MDNDSNFCMPVSELVLCILTDMYILSSISCIYSQFIFIILLYFIYFTMLCVINQDTLNVCVACVGGGGLGD